MCTEYQVPIRNKVSPLVNIVGKDRDAGNLNGMPGFDAIEDIASLLETAREKLSGLKPGSKKAKEISAAISQLENAHFSADQSSECNERGIIRERRL